MSTSLSTTAQNLKDDAVDAASAAADRVTDLASRGIDSVKRAGRSAAEAVEDTYDSAMRTSRRQLDRASSWISDNPLTAIGIGVAAGLVLGAIGRRK